MGRWSEYQEWLLDYRPAKGVAVYAFKGKIKDLIPDIERKIKERRQ